MSTYAYDIECLKNLFTATFINVNEPLDILTFCIGVGKDDADRLKRFLKRGRITLVGYNNHSYDDPMLRYIISYRGEEINNDLHTLSSKLVNDGFRSDQEILDLRYPRTASTWDSVDLMRILAFDKLGISLKQTAINLKWYKIQDMPIDHNFEVGEADVQTILDYNKNDVLITQRLYEEIAPIRELRSDLSKLYGVNLSSASDSKMANLILEKIYANELKMDMRQVKQLRTPREKVLLGDCIAKFVNFQSPELREMLDRVSPTYVYSYNNYKYNETLYFANCTFTLGVGGLHTEDAPGIFVTDDNYIIQDMDVASYYPNLIINNKFYPEHLGEDFIRVLKKITQERLEAKKSGDKVKANGLKITVNSIFGKMGLEHYWLYDPKQLLSTTVSGQMGLLMLVEGLYLNGIEILSCNTDGIVCRIPRKLEETYYRIARAWEKATGLELEYTPYKRYIRRDVNSYITEKEDGSTKEKGAFLKEINLMKGYRMPIVAKALHAYFINGTPVRETLEASNDIMDFCISQKSGANFSIVLHDTKGVHRLQKTNRFYITKRGGTLYKTDYTFGRKIGLYVGRQVGILNDYDPTLPFKKYNVDYSFYEREVMKTIDEIEPKQLSLFELSSVGKSSLLKVSPPPTTASLVEETVFSSTDLNKLGKNQIVKKVEYIANNHMTVENISSRYVYVMDFDSNAMMASVYCLSKAVRQPIYVDKKIYEKTKLEKGQIIFCDKFVKIDYGHLLVDYHIVDKFEKEAERLI